MAFDIVGSIINLQKLKEQSKKIKLRILYLSSLETVLLRNHRNYSYILGIQAEIYEYFERFISLCSEINDINKQIKNF